MKSWARLSGLCRALKCEARECETGERRGSKQRKRLVMAESLEHILELAEIPVFKGDVGLINLARHFAHILGPNWKLRLKLVRGLLRGLGDGFCFHGNVD